jgi:hypothetical protein
VVFGPALDTSGTVIDRGRGIRIFVYLTARSFDGYVFQAIEAKARGFKAILRRSVAVRVIEDVDEVVLSAAEAKALVAGDPDVLKRVQLQTEIVKLEALRAAHVDQQVQARWELKRLPQRIAELRARGESIAADVAFRNAHVPRPGTVGEGSFSFAVDGHSYAERVDAAPAFAAAIVREAELLLEDMASSGPSPSRRVADYRGFRVTVRAAGAGSVRLGLLCPARTDALEYATGRTLDVSQIPAYGAGVFQRLDHLLDALDSELKAAQDGLTREETNLASYTAQLARPFEHDESLLAARRELARIERNLTCHGGTAGPPTAWNDEAHVRMEAAALVSFRCKTGR